MKNKNENSLQEKNENGNTFDQLLEHQMQMFSVIKEEFQTVKNDKDHPDRSEKITQCVRNTDTLVRSLNSTYRRKNIEEREYDTHAGIAKSEYDKAEEAKKNAEKEAQQKSNNNAQPDNSEQDIQSDDVEMTDETEQPGENPPEMTHLHTDIKEIEDNLPIHDEPKEIIKNIKVVAPRPIIKYNNDGFRPYAKMSDMFKSQAPLKIAGGTYDAGKTYSCVAYIDMLARKYPGARLTFVHRALNRIYRNIIPTYEKYLGFRPTSLIDKNPTPIVKYGGQQPIYFEYWNGSKIYMNGLDNPNNLLSDFFDAAFVNQAELLTYDRWSEVTARVSERAGTMPIAFLVADCNPSNPNHWIRHQTKSGKIEYFELSFKDNPEIYNQETGELTEIGARRISRLQNLEGLRYKRGYEGKWESAEGLVFDTFSPDIHIIDSIELEENWNRYLSIDWGSATHRVVSGGQNLPMIASMRIKKSTKQVSQEPI